jgi:hypothetical protein
MLCQFEDLDSQQAEQAIVDAWITATECSGITEIIVEHDAVIVHGSRHQPHDVAGTALRHGDLFAELDRALESMRSPSRLETCQWVSASADALSSDTTVRSIS